MRGLLGMVAVLALGASAVTPAAAQDIQLVSQTGTCEQFTLRGFDFSEDCVGLLLQMNTMDGARTGFTARLSNGTSLAFMGTHGPKPDTNSQLQIVDTVIFQMSPDAEAITIEAEGLCGYSNPYMGERVFTCLATSDGGEGYMIVFITDGTPPSIEDGQAGGMPPAEKRPNR